MSGSTGQAGPLAAGKTRWFRNGGGRWACAALLIAFGSMAVPALVVEGIAHHAYALIGFGVVVALMVGAEVRVILRAGIGVTPEHVLIRRASGGTTRVPWADVAMFEVRKGGPRNDDYFVVRTVGEQRLETLGCTLGEMSARANVIMRWRILRGLEDERLARVPGAVDRGPVGPPDLPANSWGNRWGTQVVTTVALVLFLGIGVACLLQGLAGVRPALRAAEGAGTAGFFVPRSEACGKSCTWYGDFRLPDGLVTLRNVTLADAGAAVAVGVPVSARDTGGNGTVYPRHDPSGWAGPMIEFVMGVLISALFLILVAGQWVRRPLSECTEP